jgi:hypothetical protein
MEWAASNGYPYVSNCQHVSKRSEDFVPYRDSTETNTHRPHKTHALRLRHALHSLLRTTGVGWSSELVQLLAPHTITVPTGDLVARACALSSSRKDYMRDQSEHFQEVTRPTTLPPRKMENRKEAARSTRFRPVLPKTSPREELAVIAQTRLRGDAWVSGRAHTPSWVYRRRAHGPTLEHHQLPHGSSTHSL